MFLLPLQPLPGAPSVTVPESTGLLDIGTGFRDMLQNAQQQLDADGAPASPLPDRPMLAALVADLRDGATEDAPKQIVSVLVPEDTSVVPAGQDLPLTDTNATLSVSEDDNGLSESLLPSQSEENVTEDVPVLPKVTIARTQEGAVPASDSSIDEQGALGDSAFRSASHSPQAALHQQNNPVSESRVSVVEESKPLTPSEPPSLVLQQAVGAEQTRVIRPMENAVETNSSDGRSGDESEVAAESGLIRNDLGEEATQQTSAFEQQAPAIGVRPQVSRTDATPVGEGGTDVSEPQVRVSDHSDTQGVTPQVQINSEVQLDRSDSPADKPSQIFEHVSEASRESEPSGGVQPVVHTPVADVDASETQTEADVDTVSPHGLVSREQASQVEPQVLQQNDGALPRVFAAEKPVVPQASQPDSSLPKEGIAPRQVSAEAPVPLRQEIQNPVTSNATSSEPDVSPQAPVLRQAQSGQKEGVPPESMVQEAPSNVRQERVAQTVFGQSAQSQSEGGVSPETPVLTDWQPVAREGVSSSQILPEMPASLRREGEEQTVVASRSPQEARDGQTVIASRSPQPEPGVSVEAPVVVGRQPVTRENVSSSQILPEMPASLRREGEEQTVVASRTPQGARDGQTVVASRTPQPEPGVSVEAPVLTDRQPVTRENVSSSQILPEMPASLRREGEEQTVVAPSAARSEQPVSFVASRPAQPARGVSHEAPVVAGPQLVQTPQTDSEADILPKLPIGAIDFQNAQDSQAPARGDRVSQPTVLATGSENVKPESTDAQQNVSNTQRLQVSQPPENESQVPLAHLASSERVQVSDASPETRPVHGNHFAQHVVQSVSREGGAEDRPEPVPAVTHAQQTVVQSTTVSSAAAGSENVIARAADRSVENVLTPADDAEQRLFVTPESQMNNQAGQEQGDLSRRPFVAQTVAPEQQPASVSFESVVEPEIALPNIEQNIDSDVQSIERIPERPDMRVDMTNGVSRTASTTENVGRPLDAMPPEEIDRNFRIGEQVIRSARVLTQGGTSEVTMRLDPQELGAVTVRLISEGQVVSGEIVVESQKVQEIVQRNLGALRETLVGQGIQVENIDVSVQDRGAQADREAFRENAEDRAQGRAQDREQREQPGSDARWEQNEQQQNPSSEGQVDFMA